MSIYDKTMQAGSYLHQALQALADGNRFAGSISEATGFDTKSAFAYLQSHAKRGNVRSRVVTVGRHRRVKWTISARGRRALAGAA